jgi:hypothetical protein
MPDFTLEPDALDVDRVRPARQLTLVDAGLAAMADVPPPGKGSTETPPCYVPCRGCEALVLHGVTQEGRSLALDTPVATYLVAWDKGNPHPRFTLSRGYPVHWCGGSTQVPAVGPYQGAE